MLLALFPLLALLAQLSSTSAFQQAVCEFQGDGTGEVMGMLLLNEFDTPDGTEIEISGLLYGLSPGEHGFHIHEAGDLADNCAAAGGHFNPFGNNHGAPGAEDRHVGDLGNNHGAPGAEDRHVGDLGNVATDGDMNTFVRIEDHLVKL